MAKDLTKGGITVPLLGFTIPLIMGNLFQLGYNAVDGMIVGRYVGKEALAAVGICNPIVTLLILFINGLCLGASVLAGVQYGSGDEETMQRQISTTMLTGLIFSAFVTVLCFLLAGPILTLLHVEGEIFEVTRGYFRIILMGTVFTFLYNFFASTMRALGDSKTPLLFLMISSLCNVLGDLIFVVKLRLGANGCGVATVLSELISCLLCIAYIRKKVPALQLGRKWLVFDRSLLGKTVSYGWATAMQQATAQAGKVIVQGLVNGMGTSVVAAFAIVNRIDDFAYTPEQNIGHAMTSFLAQNRGAGKMERVRKGFGSGMLLEMLYGLLVFGICFLFAEPLMGLFVKDAEVIAQGVSYLKWISFLYLLPAMTNGIQGYFRGMGRMQITFLSSLVNTVVRVLVAAFCIIVMKKGLSCVPFSYGVGWVVMLCVELPILFKNRRKGVETIA